MIVHITPSTYELDNIAELGAYEPVHLEQEFTEFIRAEPGRVLEHFPDTVCRLEAWDGL